MPDELPVGALPAQTNPAGNSAQAVSTAPDLDLGLLTAEQLDKAIASATSVVERQDVDELFTAKNADEIEAKREVCREFRTDMLEVERERNAAVVSRARAELDVENRLAAQTLRDELDASKARALLKRMTNPVAYLASQVRVRRVALALAAAPAVVAVLIGAIQSQEAWSRLWNVTGDVLLTGALYGFEPLFTLPLVAILLYEAATPGGSVRTVKETWFRKADFDGDQTEFGSIKAGLLLASVLINVLPHLLLGELSGVAWFAVPAAIVISLSLVPKLAVGFGQRILNAKSDAELGVSSGSLPPVLAKLARQKRHVELAIKDGSYRGQLDEKTRLPSANGVRKTLAELQGAAGMPDAQNVVGFMRIERGIEE
ncbi:hypothetical protein [Prauserella marina]|uniref:hypothetical protein n=1 Tax=Prauserella marina TaxID=530584 RepID=UPI0015A172D9|nr:hypothetical protein [Prauserella marina]